MIKSQLYSFFILSYFLSFNDCTPFHITYRNYMFSHHQEFGWDPPEPPPLPLPLPLPRAPLGAPTLRWLGLRVLWGQVTCCWNLLGSSGWGAGQWKSLLVDFFTCNKRKIDMCQINGWFSNSETDHHQTWTSGALTQLYIFLKGWILFLFMCV